MRKVALLFGMFWIAFCSRSFSQNIAADPAVAAIPYHNSVYAELGGNGLVGSVNYERLIPVSDNLNVAARIGGFYLPDGKKNYGYMFPAELSLVLGRNARKFEAGF